MDDRGWRPANVIDQVDDLGAGLFGKRLQGVLRAPGRNGEGPPSFPRRAKRRGVEAGKENNPECR